MKVISSPFATKQEEVVIKRSWKERLLGWPWNPFKKTRVEMEYSPCGFQLDGDIFAVHPEIYEKMNGKLNGKISI